VSSNTALDLLAEVSSAGHCVHPIQLRGLTADVETGELQHVLFRVACKDRRASVCPSCSYLYKTDAWILISAGLVGGKGLSAEVERHARVFVTLTAPSFGAVHRSADAGECHPRSRTVRCRHGASTTCPAQHDSDDPRLGTPLCLECFDYESAVVWNAMASRLWHRTIVRLRQGVAATHGTTDRGLLTVARLNYVKVAEFQRRGLVHFHVVIRADGPEGPESSPPEWLTAELLQRQVRRLARTMTLKGIEDRSFRWGTQLEVTDVTALDDESQRIAAYLCKYAVKSTADSASFARRFRSRRHIEAAPVGAHARQLALTAWDLDGRPEFEELGLRRHAHAFGFTGQLITKSQGFSTTFRTLREARALHMAGFDESPTQVVGAFGYAGRGYSDQRGEAVAELLHAETVSMHREARQRRLATARDSRDDSRSGSRTRSHGSRSGSQTEPERTADPQ
jgi:hypothetical protein